MKRRGFYIRDSNKISRNLNLEKQMFTFEKDLNKVDYVMFAYEHPIALNVQSFSIISNECMFFCYRSFH